MITKAEFVAYFAWASVLALPWLMIMGIVLVETFPILVWVFFLVLAIISSTLQTGTNIKKS